LNKAVADAQIARRYPALTDDEEGVLRGGLDAFVTERQREDDRVAVRPGGGDGVAARAARGFVEGEHLVAVGDRTDRMGAVRRLHRRISGEGAVPFLYDSGG
jgi:hypothetical protein